MGKYQLTSPWKITVLSFLTPKKNQSLPSTAENSLVNFNKLFSHVCQNQDMQIRKNILTSMQFSYICWKTEAFSLQHSAILVKKAARERENILCRRGTRLHLGKLKTWIMVQILKSPNNFIVLCETRLPKEKQCPTSNADLNCKIINFYLILPKT